VGEGQVCRGPVGVARGDYYPAISGDASGTGIGGSARGVYGQLGVSLSYLLLDFGGREASVESASQALAAANWNHNQAIQDVLRNVPQAYYEYIGYKAQVRASEASLKEALTSLDSTEQRRRAGVSTIADVLQARSNADQVRLTLVANRGRSEGFPGGTWQPQWAGLQISTLMWQLNPKIFL